MVAHSPVRHGRHEGGHDEIGNGAVFDKQEGYPLRKSEVRIGVVRVFVENAISSLKRWVQALIEHKSGVLYRGAAKEGEFRFRIAAYAPRAVFELRFFKNSLGVLYRKYRTFRWGKCGLAYAALTPA